MVLMRSRAQALICNRDAHDSAVNSPEIATSCGGAVPWPSHAGAVTWQRLESRRNGDEPLALHRRQARADAAGKGFSEIPLLRNTWSSNPKARNDRCGLSLDCVPAHWEGLATGRVPQVQRENDTLVLNPGWRPCSSMVHCAPVETAGRFSAARAASPHSFCALR